MSRVLDVKGLNGGYGSVQILYDIDLHVEEGEFVTIIGPNGCGKSTFIKTIFGIASYYSGDVLHNDEDVSGWRTDQLVNRGIAYVPQVDNVFPSLTIYENLQMGGNSLSNLVLNERIERALNMFPDLKERVHDLAASLSGGERQMLAISRALISNPKFLLLDEPTAGVDIELRRSLWDFLTEINNEGTTIILTTHYLEEAERLCRNIAIIDSGEIVENTSMQELLTRLEEETFVFDLKNPLETLPTNLGYDAVLENPQKLKVTIGKGQGLNTIFEVLSNSGIQISSMRNDTGRLEELFMGLVDTNLNGGER